MNLNFIRYSLLGLIVIFSFVILFIVVFSGGDEASFSRDSCVNINSVESVDYMACYDAFSKNVFLEVRNRNYFARDSYVGLRVVFYDYSVKSFKVSLPLVNSSGLFEFSSDRNPISIELFLEDSNYNYCDIPLTLNVDYCPANLSFRNASLSLISSNFVDDFYSVEASSKDRVLVDLVDIDSVWEGVCSSDWVCESWGSCFDGVQKRECFDRNECAVPTSVPLRTRVCEVDCVEDWVCEWPSCVNGYSNPDCLDLNDCQTMFDKPSRVACFESCAPEFSCGEWSSCFSEYDFLTFVNGDYKLSGKQRRVCVDSNNCLGDSVEYRDCFLSVDVYTENALKCGKEYFFIYNSLNDELLASVEVSDFSEAVNVDLSGEISKEYCEHCFDGVLSGDEVGIDCGGSCRSCEEWRVDASFNEGFFNKGLNWVLDFLS